MATVSTSSTEYIGEFVIWIGQIDAGSEGGDEVKKGMLDSTTIKSMCCQYNQNAEREKYTHHTLQWIPVRIYIKRFREELGRSDDGNEGNEEKEEKKNVNRLAADNFAIALLPQRIYVSGCQRHIRAILWIQ